MKPMQSMLVTIALNYANGPLHLGHLIEAIQADIWVRWQRLLGNSCLFIGGNDAHGTPIMIAAEKQGIPPEQLIAQFQQQHQADFADFNISFDEYYTTHSPENRVLSEEIYQRLRVNGDITTQTISQAYDSVKQMFLPDRYVKGECPRCGAPDQYGDNCEVCGATYTPAELKNPISILSGTTPIYKESEHYFFQLPRYHDRLQQWLQSGHVQTAMANKLQEWFAQGLQPWDISRDAPYFGFAIPDAPGKFFYVWLDAPVGYMAIFQHLCQRRPDLSFDAYWQKESNVALYHFVGKDIVYFHALFWPAILMSANFRTPTAIFSHGFLTINGQKMSKSRDTFITARNYLNHLDAEYLRYYFAAKLNDSVEDIDLNFDDFVQRVNADLVGKVVNIASRCASFIHKQFAGKLGATLPVPKLFEEFVAAGDSIAQHFVKRDYQRGVREIMALADRANQYIDEQKPWTLAKDPQQAAQVQAVCTMGLNLFQVLVTYLKPILPHLAQRAETFLNIPELTWQTRTQPLLNHTLNPFEPLLQRITPDKIKLLLEPVS
ncbi:MAG: methionine--tRNA ligase [Gammaproteobacteria bacterium]